MHLNAVEEQDILSIQIGLIGKKLCTAPSIDDTGTIGFAGNQEHGRCLEIGEGKEAALFPYSDSSRYACHAKQSRRVGGGLAWVMVTHGMGSDGPLGLLAWDWVGGGEGKKREGRDLVMVLGDFRFG